MWELHIYTEDGRHLLRLTDTEPRPRRRKRWLAQGATTSVVEVTEFDVHPKARLRATVDITEEGNADG